MPAPLVPNPGLAQRLDLFAVTKPKVVTRNVWFFGVLGVWTLIGTVTSLAVRHWSIASLTFATFAGLHVVDVTAEHCAEFPRPLDGLSS